MPLKYSHKSLKKKKKVKAQVCIWSSESACNDSKCFYLGENNTPRSPYVTHQDSSEQVPSACSVSLHTMVLSKQQKKKTWHDNFYTCRVVTVCKLYFSVQLEKKKQKKKQPTSVTVQRALASYELVNGSWNCTEDFKVTESESNHESLNEVVPCACDLSCLGCETGTGLSHGESVSTSCSCKSSI